VPEEERKKESNVFSLQGRRRGEGKERSSLFHLWERGVVFKRGNHLSPLLM